METFKPILIEDLEIYKNGLDIEDYKFCNIISNRLITNAVFLESKEYALVGAILKEVLNFFAIVEEPKNIKRELEYFINKIIKTDKLDILFIMEGYLNFYNKMRDELNPNYEKYKENKEYSLFSTKYCLKFLNEELNSQDVPYTRDLIYFGISSELNRIFRNFGCITHQLILKALIVFLGRLYDYYRFLILSDDTKKNFWEEKYLKIKEKIKNNVVTFDIDDEYIEKTTNLLFEICKEWRLMFIRLMDITPQVKRENTSIPPKIKEELKGMVSKVTDSEIKGE